jgi:hypothetical protein
MIHNWDTVLEALPADKAWGLPPKDAEGIRKQETAYSLHPQCPEGVVYVGTVSGRGGAYDYYRDADGVYWYDRRAAAQPVAVSFRYGGGVLHQKSLEAARAARQRYPWLQAWKKRA